MNDSERLLPALAAGIASIAFGIVMAVLHYFVILANTHGALAVDIALPFFVAALVLAWRKDRFDIRRKAAEDAAAALEKKLHPDAKPPPT